MDSEPKQTSWDTRSFARAINDIDRIRDRLEKEGMLGLGDHTSSNFTKLIASMELDLEGFHDANKGGGA